MGHIREPKGVDFSIQSPPLTEKDKLEISEYIKLYKATRLRKRNSKKKMLV